MTDDPYQPPAARIGPDAGSVALVDSGLPTASLACGAVSAVAGGVLVGLSPVVAWPEIWLISRGLLSLVAIITAAASLILAIVGWNTVRWPRGMCGLVLSVLGVILTCAMLVAATAR